MQTQRVVNGVTLIAAEAGEMNAENLRAVMDAARTHGAATAALPVTDTILQADAEAFLADTPDRSLLWACQTPQSAYSSNWRKTPTAKRWAVCWQRGTAYTATARP